MMGLFGVWSLWGFWVWIWRPLVGGIVWVAIAVWHYGRTKHIYDTTQAQFISLRSRGTSRGGGFILVAFLRSLHWWRIATLHIPFPLRVSLPQIGSKPVFTTKPTRLHLHQFSTPRNPRTANNPTLAPPSQSRNNYLIPPPIPSLGNPPITSPPNTKCFFLAFQKPQIN